MKINQNFIKIESLDIPELEVYRAYNEIQLRKINEPKPGLFICESAKIIRRALGAGYEPVSILTSEANLKPANIDIESMRGKREDEVSNSDDSNTKEPDKSTPSEDLEAVFGACKDVPVYYGGDEVLRNLAGYALTGGIFAAMKRKKEPAPEEIIKDKSKIAILENVQNPTNIGAIFRSAAAMGIEAIVITYDCTDPFYRRAERVSMGCVFQIPWVRLDKDIDVISLMNEFGFATVAMALSDKAISITDKRIKDEDMVAIILGNEGYGLKEDTIERSKYVAMIPMNPIVDSLNVAAASAVMFWEVGKE